MHAGFPRMVALWHVVVGISALSCTDTREECFFWAQVGECESTDSFMRPMCPLSCGTCALDATPPSITPSDSRTRPVLTRQHIIFIGSGAADPIPFPLLDLDPIVELAAGELHLVMRLASGRVYTFGDDSMGQLGQPKLARSTPVTHREPRQVTWPPPQAMLAARSIDAGRMYSGALLTDGSLIMWGENTHSQCGVPAERTAMDPSPLELEALSLIISVPMRVPLPMAVKAFSLGEVSPHPCSAPCALGPVSAVPPTCVPTRRWPSAGTLAPPPRQR